MNQILFILFSTINGAIPEKWLSHVDWGLVLTAVPVILILGGLLYKFGRFSKEFESVAKSVNNMGADIRKNTMTLKSITTHLYSSGNATHGLFEQNSPITLTNRGKNVLELCGGQDYLDTNISTLIEEMERENLNTALDVQNYSSS